MEFGSEVGRQIKLGHAVQKHCPPGEKKNQNKAGLVAAGMLHIRVFPLCERAVCSAPLLHLSSAASGLRHARLPRPTVRDATVRRKIARTPSGNSPGAVCDSMALIVPCFRPGHSERSS